MRLAAEGAQVIVAEYNADTAATAVREIEAAGGRAAAYRIDISDAAACVQMVVDVVARGAASTSWSTTPVWCRPSP